MKQIRFIPSGCQFWWKPVIAASGSQFAFCSSTAIYIMRINDMQVERILTGHEQTITSISWSQQDPSHLASVGADGSLLVWDIDKEKIIAKRKLPAFPLICEFSPLEDDLIATIVDTGAIELYHVASDKLDKIASHEGARLVRWNAFTHGRLAFATKTGLVGFYNLKTKKTIKITGEHPTVPVEDIQWDPNSQEYLIACWKDGSMSLINSEDGNEITKFEKQGPLTCICWFKNVPGGFVTCNDKVSTIKIWNVSKKTPLSTIKVGGAPILNLINLVNTTYGKDGFLISFRDGSVGVYNYAKKSIEYATQPNHAETVFDMAFKPSNKDILATASYDGSIKIWETNQMKSIANLQKNHQNLTIENAKTFKHTIVYGVAWSPENPNQIASVTSRGEVHLWDTAKIRLLSELKPASESPMIRIDWSPVNPNLIAVGHSDGYAFVLEVANNTLRTKMTLKHPGTVYGVAWSPFNKNLLATGCKDGSVRIWDITSQTIVHNLTGHTAKSFNVAWNPLIPNVLASGSDDNTIRIWDIKQQTCSVLSGHTNNVRPIVWNSEVPWLLSSGSWDHTIITWDTRDQTILSISKEHHSDVYGIASHPERPFVYVSCSRDTSVRFWSIGKIVIPLMLRVLVTNDWDDILGIAPTSLDSKTELLKLCGTVSRRVAQETGNSTNDPIEYYDKILSFFSYLDYQKEFWDISRAILKNRNEDVSNRVVSLVNLPSIYLSQAKELESKKDSSQFTYDSTSKKSDTIMDAANMYLKLGEFELYCEALIKLGKWEKALAFAPAVSYDYWKGLSKRYAQELALDGADDTGAYYLSSGQVNEATKFYIDRGSYEDARLIAALKANNKFAHLEATDRYQTKTKAEESSRIGQHVYNSPEIRDIISNLAEDAMKAGQPLLAAAYHLSVNDGNSAVSKLLRANEPLYALALCKIYDLDIQPQVYLVIAQKADRMGERFLGNILLNQLQNKAPLEIFCADSPLQKKETNELYLQNNLSSVDKFEGEGQRYLEKGRVAEAVKYFVLSKNTEKACHLAVSTAIDCLNNRKAERIAQLPEIFEPLRFAQIYTLQDANLRNQVLGLSLYLGLKKAMWKGHYPIVTPILRILKRFVNDYQLALPINLAELELEVANFEGLLRPEETYTRVSILHKELTNDTYRGAAINIAKNLKDVLSNESRSVTKKLIDDNLNRHKVYIPGNNLPTHINVQNLPISYISGIPIKADAYMLEDVKTRITLEEALMWSECCMFSPLNTGITVNPL